MPGAGAHQVAVPHAALVDEGRATHLDIESTLGHGCHAPSPDHARRRQDLGSVADRGHRFPRLKEMADDAHQVSIVAQILRRPSSRDTNRPKYSSGSMSRKATSEFQW